MCTDKELRDTIALVAMTEILKKLESVNYEDLAVSSYALADAMMAARDK